MESSDEGAGRPQLEVPAKKKRQHLTSKTSGKCSYCMQREASQMVKLKRGSNSGFRRWICGLCLLKRQRLGLVKKGAKENYVRNG
jgi:hypothetical protein